MDASASKANSNINNLVGFYVQFENTLLPPPLRSKSSVIKYTRLPDFDPKESWIQEKSFLEPRLRRIVTIEEPANETSHSLKLNAPTLPQKMTSNITRKIVTIDENNECDLHPKFTQDASKYPAKTINRSIGTDLKDEEQLSPRSTARLSNTSKFGKEIKLSGKTNVLNSKNDNSSSKFNNKNTKFDNLVNITKKRTGNQDSIQPHQPKSMMPANITSRKSRCMHENPRGQYLKSKTNYDYKKDIQIKDSNTQQIGKNVLKTNRLKFSSFKDTKEKDKPISVIHVPRDKNRNIQQSNKIEVEKFNIEDQSNKCNRSTEIEKNFICREVDVGTEPLFKLVDCETEMSDEFITHKSHDDTLSYSRHNEIHDSLDIPNVSLTKDKKKLPKEEIVNFFSQSLPNLTGPSLNMISLEETQNEQIKESLICNNNSYIISRATVTYTSKQKIDFQVVGNRENNVNTHLRSSPLNYPISVVSVFRNELAKRNYDNNSELMEKEDKNEKQDILEQRKDHPTLNCSLAFESDKLKKPSDIIKTIKVDNNLLQSNVVCEQFQRELNFIDSFFESLQYLETCSLSDKSFTENNVEHWINGGFNLNVDSGSFLSKFENDIYVDENETMASKSLCMLNLLIRHEQRRAKNLLFVLKMREAALKDYTKSQILWLENKKKQENTDIPTLKKKQRGALLKLQHECGEMQRMRKALLTLSEKRKTALMKTKKNLEWKLENNLDVEKIIFGKKKLKRAIASDRTIAPVKCFDLSSSGCDESTTSRPKSNNPAILENTLSHPRSVEKYVQTGDSILGTILKDQSLVNTADEHFVVVDGSYLNILFRDMSLPHIFSREKQYEVNEEAVKNFLKSSTSQYFDVNKEDVLEKFIDQNKDYDVDRSSTPSTARSLVEEFDNYYKGLVEEETHSDRNNDFQYDAQITGESGKCDLLKSVDLFEDILVDKPSDMSCDFDSPIKAEIPVMEGNELELDRSKGEVHGSVGPLPVPAGAAAITETPTPSLWVQDKSSSTIFDDCDNILYSSITSVTLPVNSEAEELRRQRLAVEREIKALEQQQRQFLVIREIPDKPPPPYTPPAESKPIKPLAFKIVDTTKEKIRKYVTEPEQSDSNLDTFNIFIKDFCKDSLEKQNADHSDKLWDSCCVPPPKPQDDTEKLVKQTITDLKEVLTCVAPTIVSGVGARRSDHIDDILFAEWRKCEPEWTSLHVDEVPVKNQLFESIFQKILTETIDEYKTTVLGEK